MNEAKAALMASLMVAIALAGCAGDWASVSRSSGAIDGLRELVVTYEWPNGDTATIDIGPGAAIRMAPALFAEAHHLKQDWKMGDFSYQEENWIGANGMVIRTAICFDPCPEVDYDWARQLPPLGLHWPVLMEGRDHLTGTLYEARLELQKDTDAAGRTVIDTGHSTYVYENDLFPAEIRRDGVTIRTTAVRLGPLLPPLAPYLQAAPSGGFDATMFAGEDVPLYEGGGAPEAFLETLTESRPAAAEALTDGCVQWFWLGPPRPGNGDVIREAIFGPAFEENAVFHINGGEGGAAVWRVQRVVDGTGEVDWSIQGPSKIEARPCPPPDHVQRAALVIQEGLERLRLTSIALWDAQPALTHFVTSKNLSGGAGIPRYAYFFEPTDSDDPLMTVLLSVDLDPATGHFAAMTLPRDDAARLDDAAENA